MAIAGYKLRINGGSLVNVEIDAGLVYSHLITDIPAHDLDYSTLYQVEVAAYNDGTPVFLQSEWSAPQSITTEDPPDPPAPPPDPMVMLDGAGAVLVDGAGAVILG